MCYGTSKERQGNTFMEQEKRKNLEDFSEEEQRQILKIHLEAKYKGRLYQLGFLTKGSYRRLIKKLQKELDELWGADNV